MTREEAITKEECLAFYKELARLADVRFVPYYKMAIKALEQESVLDKIKNEIKDSTYFINDTTEKEGIDFETVERIIDKYKAESEE